MNFSDFQCLFPPPYSPSLLSVLKEKRGGGYWIPRVLAYMKEIQSAQDGDVIAFADCGMTFNTKEVARERWAQYLRMISNKDMIIMANEFKDIMYTTKEIFEYWYEYVYADNVFVHDGRVCTHACVFVCG